MRTASSVYRPLLGSFRLRLVFRPCFEPQPGNISGLFAEVWLPSCVMVAKNMDCPSTIVLAHLRGVVAALTTMHCVL